MTQELIHLDRRWEALVEERVADPSIASQLQALRLAWRKDAQRALREGTVPDDQDEPDEDDHEVPDPPDATLDVDELRAVLDLLVDAAVELPEELAPDAWLDEDAPGPAAALFVPIAVWCGRTFAGRTLARDGDVPWALMVPLFLRIARTLDAPDPDQAELDALEYALEYPLDDAE
jgi:hypothetical protein